MLKIRDLVKEYKSTGTAYRRRLYTVMRSFLASHYRRMIPQLLEVLEFRSNTKLPVMMSLSFLGKDVRAGLATLKSEIDQIL